MQNKQKISIWLDCDPGFDDAIAIIMAARDKRLNLLGVSSSPGNIQINQATKNILDLLYNANRQDVDVIKGSEKLVEGEIVYAEHIHGKNGLSDQQLNQSPQKAIIKQDPFKQIAIRITVSHDKVTWISTGTLTNLYFILKKYPQITNHLKQIIVMGGSTGKGNVTPAAQFNMFADSHAAKGVFQMKKNVPITMIPLDLTHTILGNQQVFDELESLQTPLPKIIFKLLKGYQARSKKSQGFDYPPMHDPMTIYYVLNPQELKCYPARIQIDTCKVSRGRTNMYFSNPENPDQKIKTIDKVCLQIEEVSKFWDLNLNLYNQLYNETRTKQFTRFKNKKQDCCYHYQTVIIAVVFLLIGLIMGKMIFKKKVQASKSKRF